ncbi:DUF1987 domain-containing protein [Pseudodesulfovibrio tunisiensis]|uniref:DUF1987 domain-containing protein n=1 Tax=Pseudodesulfovibrio tunisiensis TaxID=463192 RepID=UPI001FB39180|nr:DUF1987 domain-containing protein [Pseudodesulfovibrio tunisiensis]
MTKYTVQGTKSSPFIDFDPTSGVFEIRGESYPENCSRFYTPMFDWLASYMDSAPRTRTELNMEVIYFNSSTSKVFMDLFDMLDNEAAKGRNIVVNWRYHEENEIAQECGEEFMEDVSNVRFNLVEIPA